MSIRNARDSMQFIRSKFPKELAMANRFGIEIHGGVLQRFGWPPALESINVLCQEATLPQTGLTLKQMRWDEGPFFHRPQGIDLATETLAFTFLLDGNMLMKQFFEAWILYIWDMKKNSLKFPSDYLADIDIYTLDSADFVRNKTTVKGAFPRNISIVSLSQQSATPLNITVSFAFHTHSTEYQMFTPAEYELAKSRNDISTDKKNTHNGVHPYPDPRWQPPASGPIRWRPDDLWHLKSQLITTPEAAMAAQLYEVAAQRSDSISTNPLRRTTNIPTVTRTP